MKMYTHQLNGELRQDFGMVGVWTLDFPCCLKWPLLKNGNCKHYKLSQPSPLTRPPTRPAVFISKPNYGCFYCIWKPPSLNLRIHFGMYCAERQQIIISIEDFAQKDSKPQPFDSDLQVLGHPHNFLASIWVIKWSQLTSWSPLFSRGSPASSCWQPSTVTVTNCWLPCTLLTSIIKDPGNIKLLLLVDDILKAL